MQLIFPADSLEELFPRLLSIHTRLHALEQICDVSPALAAAKLELNAPIACQKASQAGGHRRRLKRVIPGGRAPARRRAVDGPVPLKLLQPRLRPLRRAGSSASRRRLQLQLQPSSGFDAICIGAVS